MAESTPPSRASLDEDVADEPVAAPSVPDASRPSSRFRDAAPSDGSLRSRPLRLIDAPARASQPSLSGARDAHPPSEPRPIPGRPGADAGPDRPARVQLIAALLLLLVLVVVPLYLWRRPRAASNDETKPVASALVATATATASAEPPRTKNGVTVGDAKVIGCHDRGSKRTPADQCDHLPAVEGAFSKAILDASSCVSQGTPAGEIAFVLDASYARHKSPMRVRHGREDTTLPAKAVAECVAEVRKSLASISLDGAHAHARYEIEIDATYGAKP